MSSILDPLPRRSGNEVPILRDPFGFVSTESLRASSEAVLEDWRTEQERKRLEASRARPQALPDVLKNVKSIGEAGTLMARSEGLRADVVVSVTHRLHNACGLYWFDRKKKALVCCLYTVLSGWEVVGEKAIFPMNLLLSERFDHLLGATCHPFQDPDLVKMEKMVQEMFDFSGGLTTDFEQFLFNPFDPEDLFPSRRLHDFRFRPSAFPGIPYLHRRRPVVSPEEAYQTEHEQADVHVLFSHLTAGSLRLYHRETSMEITENEGCIFCARFQRTLQRIKDHTPLDPDFVARLFGGEKEETRGLGVYPFPESFRAEWAAQIRELNDHAAGRGNGLPLLDTRLLQRLASLLQLDVTLDVPEGLRVTVGEKGLPVLMGRSVEDTGEDVVHLPGSRIVPVIHADCSLLTDEQLIELELHLLQPAQKHRVRLDQLRSRVLQERRRREVDAFLSTSGHLTSL